MINTTSNKTLEEFCERNKFLQSCKLALYTYKTANPPCGDGSTLYGHFKSENFEFRFDTGIFLKALYDDKFDDSDVNFLCVNGVIHTLNVFKSDSQLIAEIRMLIKQFNLEKPNG